MKKLFKLIKILFNNLKITLGCLLGLHAWVNNVCVNCGKRR